MLSSDVGDQSKTPSGPLSGDELKVLAQSTLDHFDVTVESALAGLANPQDVGVSSLASLNTMTSGATLQSFDHINDGRRKSLALLSREPAIARVSVVDDDGRERVIFIARATPQSPGAKGSLFASYRSPLGQLASVLVGQEYEIKVGGRSTTYLVVDRANLRPIETGNGWDAPSTAVHRIDAKPVTILSLRELISARGSFGDDVDLLQSMFDDDVSTSGVIEGLQRTIIDKINLRDLPALDAAQDEIFRLPIDTSVLILGPPGSGKTTTLIKRLGLKLDLRHLADDEVQQIERTATRLQGHAQSWLMFTPTELLQAYVKQAFAIEDVPAPPQRVQTWTKFSFDVARNSLGILRTSTSRGAYLREELPSLQASALEDQIAWFGDFASWQDERYWSELLGNAQALAAEVDPISASLGRRLLKAVQDRHPDRPGAAFLDLVELGDEIVAQMRALRKSVDDALRTVFSAELRADPDLLKDLLKFVGTLGESADAEELDDPDAEAEEDDEETKVSPGGREAAFEAYRKAARAYARAVAAKRLVNRRTANGKILEWLGDRALPRADGQLLGEKLQTVAALGRFSNPIRKFIGGVAPRYRRFRRERQATGIWYQATGFGSHELGQLEVDAIILATLRSANGLMTDRGLAARLEEPALASLRAVRGLRRNQIVVDEATDFAPIQLASMAALCDPVLGSFVACGDFNQRLTSFGSRTVEDIQWAVPNLQVRSILVTYRHSRQLNELAHAVAALEGPDAVPAELPEFVNNEGVDPVLALGLTGSEITDWLAQRIIEIERFTKTLPSIAVLVNSEAEVEPIAVALTAALADLHILAVACKDGKVVGEESDVRVFNVQHIKGLEFEAVFFVGVDELMRQRAGLFEKYLYVGATRAATYLGLTCSEPELPPGLASLAPHFALSWPRP